MPGAESFWKWPLAAVSRRFGTVEGGGAARWSGLERANLALAIRGIAGGSVRLTESRGVAGLDSGPLGSILAPMQSAAMPGTGSRSGRQVSPFVAPAVVAKLAQAGFLVASLAGYASAQEPVEAPAPRAAPGWLVVRASGGPIRGQLEGATATALSIRSATDGVVEVPFNQMLSLHGVTPGRAHEEVIASLIGKDRIHGRIQGGDANGDTLTIVSKSLGPLSIPLDVLEVLLLSPEARRAGASAFIVPESDDADEALFRTVQRGYDTMLGEIHRFSSRGLTFHALGAGGPRLFLYRKLDAISSRGAYAREDFEPDVRLLTRSGDSLRLRFVGVATEAKALRFEQAGGRALSVPYSEVCACAWIGTSRRYLSDLEPIRVVERGSAFDDGATPLYSFQRDKSVVGSPLVVRGEAHAKGLGVHAACELIYRVPKDSKRLVARVGIDDTVLATSIRSSAEVSVLVNGEVVFGPVTVESGGPAESLAVPVEPGGLLTLRATFGEGRFFGDRVDWLAAAFVR